MMQVINVDDVTVVKKGNIILNNLSFDINQGTFVSIIGGNGSGKSTLVKTLAGLDKYSGYISINGYYLDEAGINDIRKNVSVIFDELDEVLLGNTVWENLTLNLVHLGKSESYIKKRVTDVCTAFEIDRRILHKKMVLIDNSMRQKIMIASAIIANPSIIILDDCLHQLSYRDRKRLLSLLNKVKREEKITILMVTHNMEDILISDRVLVLDEGKILFDGTVGNVFRNNKKLEEIGVGIPFMIDLSLELIKRGKINNIYLNEGKLVGALWK